MSTNLAIRGGDLGYDVVVEIEGAEAVGNDWIVDDISAAAVADAWALEHPVARSWSVAPNNGMIVLVDHTQEGRPTALFWARAGADQFLLGAAPIAFKVEALRRKLSDAAALDELKRLLRVPGTTLDVIAGIVQETGRAVL